MKSKNMNKAIKETCVVAALLGLTLAACVSGSGPGDGLQRAEREAVRPDRDHDGPVFEGAAADLPGSFARLVLEKNFRQTRRLRWQSSDTKIGAAEVDFFEPREWRLEGDPPDTLRFQDRSPGPILIGVVRFGPPHQAVVNVVLGRDRVTYTLNRVERAGLDTRGQ